MDLSFEIETEALSQILEQLDYFQILKVAQTASPAEIKAAFYQESRLYHPDRYHALPACAFKEQAGKIYKRVTEAYVTLRDDRKRQKYLADIGGPEREKKLRYSEESDQEAKAAKKKELEEQIGQTPKGRQLYQQALRDLEAQKVDAAIRNLKLALTFEPSNERFKEQLKAVEKQLPKVEFKIGR
ncbi:MAG: J domain-containing protein [Deltaproteobacteria bacterium]